MWKVLYTKWNLDNIFQYVQQDGKSVAFQFSEKILPGFCSNQCFMSRWTWEIFYIYCQIFVTFIAQLKRSKSSNSWPILLLQDFCIFRILSYCPALWLKAKQNTTQKVTPSPIFSDGPDSFWPWTVNVWMPFICISFYFRSSIYIRCICTCFVHI